MPVDQFLRDVLGYNEPEEAPPRPGALRWVACLAGRGMVAAWAVGGLRRGAGKQPCMGLLVAAAPQDRLRLGHASRLPAVASPAGDFNALLPLLIFLAAGPAPAAAGARRIIRWQIRHVYSVGVTARHPANRRVKAWVYLRDLQEQYGLTGRGRGTVQAGSRLGGQVCRAAVRPFLPCSLR